MTKKEIERRKKQLIKNAKKQLKHKPQTLVEWLIWTLLYILLIGK